LESLLGNKILGNILLAASLFGNRPLGKPDWDNLLGIASLELVSFDRLSLEIISFEKTTLVKLIGSIN